MNPADEDLARIISSARRLGVEVDEAEALAWLSAMAQPDTDQVTLDVASGVFGHRITMLDFSPTDLAHFRVIGQIVHIPDRPGVVETALALSGSAAQSKIQTHPGDCDFFERVNIIAPTRDAATAILADVIRGKVESTLRGSNYRFVEVRFGGFPVAGRVGARQVEAGASMQWTPEEVLAGRKVYEDRAGSPVHVDWKEASTDSGWVKLDWIVAHPATGGLACASNVLDVTWEAPDGSIVPLDGQLDPYFQEVYLDAASIPIFSKVARHVAGDALDSYVEALEGEVRTYLTPGHENYGKVAKRLYNVFRLTGRHAEAAYLRELFDGPGAMLYQVAALIETADEAEEADFDRARIAAQLDQIVLSVVAALDGEQELSVVASVLKLRAALLEGNLERDEDIAQASTVVMDIVNDYFRTRLLEVDSIAAYLQSRVDAAAPE